MAIVFIEMKRKLCSEFFNLHKPLERDCRNPGHGNNHAGAQLHKQTRWVLLVFVGSCNICAAIRELRNPATRQLGTWYVSS